MRSGGSEVTSSSALLWTRAPRAGTLELRIGAKRIRLQVGRNDLTANVLDRGLRPATRYTYSFVQGAAKTASGRSAPRPPPPRTCRSTSRSAATRTRRALPGSAAPFYNRFEVYAQMAAEKNDFAVNLGDTIYSDSEVPGSGRRRSRWPRNGRSTSSTSPWEPGSTS